MTTKILQGNVTGHLLATSFNCVFSVWQAISETILCVGHWFPRKIDNQLAKLAIVTLAAGVLTLGSVHDASAAKTGGRVGGQAFRPSAPRSAPRINNNSSSR